MINRKHTAALTSLIMAAALLTGCQENAAPLTGGTVTNEDLAPAAAPESTAVIDDEAAPLSAVVPDPSRIIVNCTLPEAPAQVPLLKTAPLKFEVGVPEKLFFDDAGLVEGKDYYKYDHPDKDHHVYCDTASDLLLMGYSDGDISSYNRTGNYHYTSIRSAFDVYKMTNYFSDTALEGFTAEDAISRGNELLAKLGITNAGAPKVWAVTADKANEYNKAQNWEKKDGTPDEGDKWTADDEVYFLTYPIEFNGIPVTTTCTNRYFRDKTDGFEYINGAYIEMIVRKDSIADVRSYQLMSEDAEVIGTADIAVTPQQALDTLIQHYNTSELLTDDAPVTVTGCSLVYVDTRDMDTNEYTLRPVWQFDLEWEFGWEGRSEASKKYENMGIESDYVDAVTGEAHFEVA